MRKIRACYGKTNHQEVPDSDRDRRPNERVTNEPDRKFRRVLTPPGRVWICSSSDVTVHLRRTVQSVRFFTRLPSREDKKDKIRTRWRNKKGGPDCHGSQWQFESYSEPDALKTFISVAHVSTTFYWIFTSCFQPRDCICWHLKIVSTLRAKRDIRVLYNKNY